MAGRRTSNFYVLRIVAITSLFWILTYSVFILYFASPQCGNNEHVSCDDKKNLVDGETVFSKIPLETSLASKSVGLFGSIFGNGLTRESKPGDDGRAVQIPEHLKEEAKKKFAENQFNLVASNLMAMDRTLPDYRISQCHNKFYPKNLPTTSVVIVFHNEAWTTLLRTVHSVINRSPHNLLREIIMVDDASQHAHLGAALDEYVARLPVSTRLLRMPQRTGLIRARLVGAANSTSDTITFLDAHCEVTIGWLEPLLAEIKKNRRSVVCPIIDVISDETFEYVTGSDMTWGGFNWKMSFRWYPVPQRELTRRGGDRSLPLRTPTMAGGLFTINRKFFYEIGAYDPLMEIWGGENLEMSFRVWQCHGQLLIVTCSRVGHVFRKTSPYSWPGGVANILNKNNMRTAAVWMDEYREFFFKVHPGVKDTKFGDISKRLEIRRSLKCHNFQWYLDKIYPESLIPRVYFSLGEIRNKITGRCIDSMGRKNGELAALIACHGLGGNQVWSYNSKKAIQQDDLCLDISNVDSPLKLTQCHGLQGNQLFVHDRHTLQIRHPSTNQCIGTAPTSKKDTPFVGVCVGAPSQQWILGDMNWQLYEKSSPSS